MRVVFFRDASFWCLGAATLTPSDIRQWQFMALALFCWGLDVYVNREVLK